MLSYNILYYDITAATAALRHAAMSAAASSQEGFSLRESAPNTRQHADVIVFGYSFEPSNLQTVMARPFCHLLERQSWRYQQ